MSPKSMSEQISGNSISGVLMPEISGSDSLDDLELAGSKISGISASFTTSVFSALSVLVVISETLMASAFSILSVSAVLSVFICASAASVDSVSLILFVLSKGSELSEISGASEFAVAAVTAVAIFSVSLSFLSDSLLPVSFSGNVADMAETSSGI